MLSPQTLYPKPEIIEMFKSSEYETQRQYNAQSLVHSWKLLPILDLIQRLGLGERGVGHLVAVVTRAPVWRACAVRAKNLLRF